MLNMSSYNLAGSSRIDGVDVAYFNASISLGDNVTFSVSNNVNDKGAYIRNKEQVDTDYESFQAKVMELSNSSID